MLHLRLRWVAAAALAARAERGASDGLLMSVVWGVGLPLPSGSTAPPANLTLPAGLVEPEDDTQVYITVLQEFDGCPVSGLLDALV